MDPLREQLMINQFALVAGCNPEQAKQLLQLNNWQFQKALTVFLQEVAALNNPSSSAASSSATESLSKAQSSIGSGLSPFHHAQLAAAARGFNPFGGPSNSPFNFPETLLAFLKLSQASEQHHQQSLLANAINQGLNIPHLANDIRLNHQQLHSSHQRQQLASPMYADNNSGGSIKKNSRGDGNRKSAVNSLPAPAMSFNLKSTPATHGSGGAPESASSKPKSISSDLHQPQRKERGASSSYSKRLHEETISSDEKRIDNKVKRGRNKQHAQPLPPTIPSSSAPSTASSTHHPHHSQPNQQTYPQKISQSPQFNPFDIAHLTSSSCNPVKASTKSTGESFARDKRSNDRASISLQQQQIPDGGDMPLNLCVKRAYAGQNQGNISTVENANDGINPANRGNLSDRGSLFDASVLERPRKRGRKPRSLLANMPDVLMIPEQNDAKPKRRGRPPILSPPLPSSSNDDQNIHQGNEDMKTLSQFEKVNNKLHTSIIPQDWSNFPPVNSMFSSSEPPKSVNACNKSHGKKFLDNPEVVSCASEELSHDGVDDDDSDIEDGDGNDVKSMSRPNIVYNEEDLRKPLKFGWRRQTLLKCLTKAGVEGEVIYYSPCGRKLRNYSDVSREFSILTESEIEVRLEEMKKGINKASEVQNDGEDSEALSESDRRTSHDESDHRDGRNDIYSHRSLGDNYARITAEEFNAAREDMFRKFQECKENKRYHAEVLKDPDLYKKRDYQMIAEVDRERRKQHMTLIRAMDAHRRYEEREKERERVNAEKRIIQERKYKKRKLELEIMRELRRPVEDMILKRSTPLPTLSRIPGLKLPGKVFAELLMVYEFLHNFGETLGFDMDSLPTLNTLHKALLNLDSDAEEELISTLHHLLVCAIDDPGTPCHVTTVMGQKLRDTQISNFNLSEVLKVYFQSFANQYSDESPHENHIAFKIYNLLSTGRPFLSLKPAQKMEILTFLCNELSSNQAIVRQIEETMETVANLRKERWHLGCELRKHKAIKLRREKGSEEAGEELKKFDKYEIDGGLLDDSAESEVEDNIIITVHETEEDAGITDEELDKKLNKLAKECSQINNKLNKAIQSLKISPLGQDRFRRRYWFLPAAGGIFIEGIESGQPEEIENNEEKTEDSSTEEVNESDSEAVAPEECKDQGHDIEAKIENVNDSHDPINEGNEDSKRETNCEALSLGREKKSSKEVTVTIQPIVSQEDLTQVKKEEIKCNMEIEINPTTIPPPAKESWDPSAEKTLLDTPNDHKNGDEPIKNGPSTNGLIPPSSACEQNSNHLKPEPKKQWFSVLPRTPCNDATILYPEKKPSSPTCSSNNDKENSTKNEQDTSTVADEKKNDDQADNVNGAQPNNLVNAFLYPHLLESFFQQIRPNNGKCPSSESPSESLPMNSNQTTLNDEADPSQAKLQPPACNSNLQLANMDPCSRLEAEIALFQATLDSTELALDPELERKLVQNRKMQYRRHKRIPKKFQRGWWRITDSNDVGMLVSTLNEKGIRERQLLRHLNKYVNYVSSRCRTSVAELDHSHKDAPLSPPPSDDDSSDDWNRNLALRLDIAVLEQIEALEEKIASSSMQIRGWRPLPKITTDSTIRFELSSSYMATNVEDGVTESSSNNSATTGSGRMSKSEASKKVVDPLKIGRERILTAEAMIERRYLKPPLGFKANTIIFPSSSSGGGSDEYADNAADENAPSGLLRWRDAVRECASGSQLALLLHFLESCIAWDKSIMRASCQFCSSGENEAQLLLCDGCDKGYHMYCFKPKMETVPEGDWFCFECQNKNTIDKVCIVCGKKGKLINCDTCPKVFHPNCLDPPVTKPPKGRWCCNMCNRKPKKKIGRKGPNTQVSSSNEDRDPPSSSVTVSKESEKRTTPKSRQKKQEPPPPPPPSVEETPAKETKKDKKSKDHKEMAVCGALLSEIEKHDDCWPFLFPVNTKQFPTYKKIIKKPMDFTTIKSRLESGVYKNKSEFIQDCRLIFDNCETFNEDESPVGQAGHNMRKFMDKRWKELNGEKAEKS